MVAQASERRINQRYAVTGKIPGTLTDGQGSSYHFFALDVSRSGMGIVTGSPMATSTCRLKLDDPRYANEIAFAVRWTKIETTAGEEIYRCGLEVEDKDQDLVAIIQSIPNVILEDIN